MKQRLLLLATTLFLTINTYAQTVNGVPLKDLDTEYVQIISDNKILSDKLTIVVDYGQDRKQWDNTKQTKILDANGREMLFNSMIDALNFMSKNGYELVHAFGESRSDAFHQYLLRKRKKS